MKNAIDRRTFINSSVGALALAALGDSVDAQTKRPPNIILIVADDLGFADLGCYGGEIDTPNLDRMAAEGMRFKQFFNCAVCNISRVAMMTGVHPRFTGGRLLRPNLVTIAEALKGAGYATAMSGKWHLGGEPTRPIDRGFDEYYGSMIGAVNFFDPSLPDPPFVNHSGPKQPFVHNADPIKGVAENYYVTEAITDHAIGQIKKFARQDKPFFLHLAHFAPHYPMQALPQDIAKYRGKYDEGYHVLRRKRYRRMIELGIISDKWKLPAPDPKLGNWRYDLKVDSWDSIEEKQWEIQKMEVYSAMVDRMDKTIGRLMASLKETGIDDNTLVVFFSDNGGCASDITPDAEKYPEYRAYNKGKSIGGKDSYVLCGPGWATAQSSPFRRYKTWTYEGGLTTPMIVRWKGKIRPNTITNEVGHLIDLLPTFLEASGAKYPGERLGAKTIPIEGKSLMPVLSGGKFSEDRELGWFLYGSRAYRIGKWKLVWGVTGKKWELYNMDADRTETTDLSAKHPQLVKKLTDAWQVWAKRSEVPENQM
ncbi:MAG: arylsulfatase [Pyrinomonadaceae bacterium]